MVEVILVGTIGCAGTEKTEKIIREIIEEEGLLNQIIFKKVIYTGQEKKFDPPIYGSPTILINGLDVVFGDQTPGITLA
jgi:hypothetical protein